MPTDGPQHQGPWGTPRVPRVRHTPPIRGVTRGASRVGPRVLPDHSVWPLPVRSPSRASPGDAWIRHGLSASRVMGVVPVRSPQPHQLLQRGQEVRHLVLAADLVAVGARGLADLGGVFLGEPTRLVEQVAPLLRRARRPLVKMLSVRVMVELKGASSPSSRAKSSRKGRSRSRSSLLPAGRPRRGPPELWRRRAMRSFRLAGPAADPRSVVRWNPARAADPFSTAAGCAGCRVAPVSPPFLQPGRETLRSSKDQDLFLLQLFLVWGSFSPTGVVEFFLLPRGVVFPPRGV